MRIWVTGIGVTSPLARGAGPTMDRLLAGDRAIDAVSLFPVDDGSRARVAAEIRDLFPALVAPPGQADAWSRTDAMAVLAAREALAEARLDPAALPVDLIVGGTTAGMFETESTLVAASRDPDGIAPIESMRSHPLSSTADHVAVAAGPFRVVRTVCSACSSGANAILLGAARIRSGRARAVLAGGADGLCRLTYAGFGALAALSPEPCRPFDRRRTGLTLGEGAAFLVLELEDAARARGASPIVELRGWAVSAEAHHITNPEASGETAASVMQRALERAAITPAEVDYVNAHGTATVLNDAMEAAALKLCLGVDADRVPVSSSKGQIGHTLGGAGAIEAAITAMAIARGELPPTIGLEEVDAACALVHVTRSRKAPLRAAMSDSFGFGGTDSVLVFADATAFPEPAAPPRRRIVVTAAATVGPLGVHGLEGTRAYLTKGPPPDPGAIVFQPSAHLDVARARRMDRAAKLVTVAIATARDQAALSIDSAAQVIGAVVGSAFGSVEGTATFLRRLFEKGSRLVSPADFPNLVPSSPVGHASIYLGLKGPVLSTSDLDATALSALATAAELISAGEGDAMFAGSVEEQSPLIDRCLGPLCSGGRGPRSEGAAIVLLEAIDRAEARGARIVAEVAFWTSWRTAAGGPPLAEAPAPFGVAEVFAGREDERLDGALFGSPWAAVPRRSVATRSGDHEGAAGFAFAAAAAELAAGNLDAAMVVGVTADQGHAFLLTREPG